MTWLPFADRREGGRALARALATLAEQPSRYGDRPAAVLALPRGGVPVAFEVARTFDLPLDVFVVRKLGTPGHEELAMGAIASGDARVLNDEVIDSLGIDTGAIEREIATELEELHRREALYRDGRPPVAVAGRRAILVDDGLATGASMRAAVLAVRSLNPAEVIVAVPVAAPDACDDFADEVDDIVCAATPEPFRAIGLWYREFRATSDDEVRELLAQARRDEADGGTSDGDIDREIDREIDDAGAAEQVTANRADGSDGP